MNTSDDELRSLAKMKVAYIFKLEPGMVRFGAVFGEDLTESFVSDFSSNEFDQLNNDIRDAADSKILKELSSGALAIRTVDDYCEHMVRCYGVHPETVMNILRINA